MDQPIGCSRDTDSRTVSISMVTVLGTVNPWYDTVYWYSVHAHCIQYMLHTATTRSGSIWSLSRYDGYLTLDSAMVAYATGTRNHVYLAYDVVSRWQRFMVPYAVLPCVHSNRSIWHRYWHTVLSTVSSTCSILLLRVVAVWASMPVSSARALHPSTAVVCL